MTCRLPRDLSTTRSLSPYARKKDVPCRLGEKEDAFRDFVEKKTGQRFYRRRLSPMQRLMEWMKKLESEPEHL